MQIAILIMLGIHLALNIHILTRLKRLNTK